MSYTTFDRFVAWRRFRVAIAHVRPQSRVCDIGCGLNAAFLRYAGSHVNFGVGLDYQPFQIRAGLPPLIQCDLTKSIPLRKEEFDHAIMLAVFEHLEDPRPILSESFRILKRRGSLIMTWPQAIVDPILNVLHSFGMVSPEMESEKHQVRIPVENLIRMLGEIGFNKFEHKRFELGMNNLLVSWKP
jgi:ubiquinone/menaquinone biosynthesis C-methylase UbiE